MAKLFRNILSVFFLLWAGSWGFAQSPHPSFHHYTVEDGLPGSEVYQVKQDSKGYIWFATGNGVSRFNGYEFENFSMEDGLPDNTVFEIFEDKKGRIWFLPLSCKLSYYEDGKIHTYEYNGIFRLFINPIKSSFYVHDNGSVFMGLANQGIYEITADGDLITHSTDHKFKGTYDIMEPGPSNFVFFGNDSGEEPIARIRTRYQNGNYRLPLEKMPVTLSVFRLIRLRNHSLVFSYDTRMITISAKGEVKVEEFPERITWLYEDRDNDLWVGMYQKGVYHLPNGDFKQRKAYLDGNSVDGVLQDKEGGFWFATEGNYVFYTPSKKVLVFDESTGLGDDRINCLETDGSHIFAGTSDGYVVQVSDSLTVKQWYLERTGGKMMEILSLYYDKPEKQLLISGRGSLMTLTDGRLGQLKKNGNMFYRMVKTTRGDRWGSYSYGLYCYNNLTVNQYVPKVQRVNGLLAGADNHIFLGTINGLWDFNSITMECEYLGIRNPLLQNRIMDMEYIGDSILVMATKGAGVLVYDFKNAYQIDVSRGLCGNNVYELYVDDNTVWAATNEGLNRISFHFGGSPSYVVNSYTVRDGLPSNEIKHVMGLNGKIWVATYKGLAFFEPGDIMRKGSECPIYINRIQVNDRDMDLQRDYHLGYTQNSLKIGFTGLGYRNAGKLHYRYRMLGLDSSWSYTDNREIQFTTLPGGDYRFVVSVQNNDGTWSREVAIAEFYIVIPFWKRWWFQGVAILLLASLVVVFIRYRLKLTQKEKERDNELNRNLLTLKLKALRAQMNPHFTFNVMNSIQHFILYKEEESAHRYLSKFSRLIRTILNNSETDAIPLAEELKALELYLELESMRFEHSFAYHIEVDKSINPLQVMVPSMLMQPYVENAILHGILPMESGGKIQVHIEREGKLLKCIIEDNGVGRAKAAETKKNKEHKSFGTSITKERLSAINELHNSFMSESVIDLYDTEGRPAGTRIVIYIPMIKTDEHESDYY